MQFIKSRILYYKSRENPYQVLQVTCAASERAMKSKVRMINSYHHSTKLYRKKYHSFVAVGIADGNKLVIFSGIALYYGDTYII